MALKGQSGFSVDNSPLAQVYKGEPLYLASVGSDIYLLFPHACQRGVHLQTFELGLWQTSGIFHCESKSKTEEKQLCLLSGSLLFCLCMGPRCAPLPLAFEFLTSTHLPNFHLFHFLPGTCDILAIWISKEWFWWLSLWPCVLSKGH